MARFIMIVIGIVIAACLFFHLQHKYTEKMYEEKIVKKEAEKRAIWDRQVKAAEKAEAKRMAAVDQETLDRWEFEELLEVE